MLTHCYGRLCILLQFVAYMLLKSVAGCFAHWFAHCVGLCAWSKTHVTCLHVRVACGILLTRASGCEPALVPTDHRNILSTPASWSLYTLLVNRNSSSHLWAGARLACQPCFASTAHDASPPFQRVPALWDDVAAWF